MRDLIQAAWSERILPALHDYIRIPNQSPAFDRDWEAHGHMQRAVQLVADWVRAQAVPGLHLEVIQLPGRTPLLWMDMPGSGDDTVLLYGHLDKQPPMEGWSDGLGPWSPVLRDGKLYGRGGADDGYAAFACVAALQALAQQRVAHARCVVLIEACEESGSYDLPAYIEALADRIGTPSLVVCLDSGCGNYEQLWVTTSLRGLVGGALTVTVLDEGVHSGAASGVVPSSFRIARQLLSRVEDERTGEILPPALHVPIPAERRAQADAAAAVLGDAIAGSFPFAAGTQPVSADPAEQLLNRTWRPQLAVVGAAGLPEPGHAGNVLRPRTTLKLSLRLPPTLDAAVATRALRETLTSDPPYGAQVRFDAEQGTSGWNAPPLAPWLADSVARASRDAFGRDACFQGEGGTIPFMAMLGERFPAAQFVITGVLGPRSNAHGPNEFLHVATAARLTACVAQVLADHARRA
ncbi:MAG: M20 family metallopeptidase [Deltaproteobacteria bacterium]|nr:M20 family metallopeptidase [Deltaproteobacteria bacterium]